MVRAQAQRNIPTGLEQGAFDFFRGLPGQAGGGRGHADSGHGLFASVKNRYGDTAHAGEEFLIVIAEAGFAHILQFPQKSRVGLVRNGRPGIGPDFPQGFLNIRFFAECEKSLARRGIKNGKGGPHDIVRPQGMLFFVTTCKMGLSLLAGALTLSIMVLPVIMRTTEEALLAVPDSFREGSFGLGAGKLRTVFRIVLPPAIPGISSGIILAMGRIVGETAALIYTAGTVAEMPKNIFSSTRTLAVHMYSLSSEGLYMDQAYATAVVLLVIVMLINLGSTFVAKKINKY